MTLAMFGRSANDAKDGAPGALDLSAAIIASSCDAIISQTLDGVVTSWNPAANDLFGYSPEEMIGESVRRLIPCDRQDEEDRILARIKAGERVESYVTIRWDKEQRPIDVSLTISPIWDQSRKIIAASKIYRPIASQKEAVEALRWRQFVDQAPVAMLVLDRNMVHLACSRRWVELHRCEAGLGRYHYDLFPQVPEHWREAHRKGLAGETVSADEEVFLYPDGSKQWLRWEVRPWLMSDGTSGGITIMTEDVTDRVLTVQALRESEMRMRLAQEAAKAGAWEWRLADNSLQWSDSLWGLYGLQKPEGWQSTIEAWAAIMHPSDRERVVAAVMGAAALGHDYAVPWRLNVPKGEPERWFVTRGSPMAGANGSPDRYFGVVLDITEQKLAEDALRQSEVRMHLAQEAARSGAWEWNLVNNRIQWSDSLWSLFGVPKPERWEPTLEAWRKLVHPADRQRITLEVWESTTLGRDVEVQWRLHERKAGPERWFLSRGRPIADANGALERYFGVIIEITEQKLMEAALRESKDRQTFLLSLSDSLRFTDEPAEAIAIAAKMLGRKLNASQIVYSKFEAGECVSVMHSWHDGVGPDTFAPDKMDDLDPSFLEALANGQTIAVSDVSSDPRCSKPEAQAFLERGSVAAFIVVPFVKERKVAGVLGVHRRHPYPWKEDEITLAQDVAQRTWDLVERALAVQALRVSEERQSFLLSLNDALRIVDDPFEAIATASKMLGQKLNANQVVYARTHETGERASVTHEWNDGVPSGAFALEMINDFAPSLVEDLAHGQTVAVSDVRSDSHTCNPEALAIFENGSIAAFVTVPFIKNRRLLGALAVHKRTAHAWKAEEITLTREVAERTWEAVERALAVQALRVSEERQSFLLGLNDALRTVDDPFEAIATASRMLGRKLNANQVVYGKVDATGEGVSITHDWNDDGAPGTFVIHGLDVFDASFIEDLRSGKTVAVDDTQLIPRFCGPETRAVFERGSVAAFITVPFVKSQRLAGVLAVHKHQPHPWTKDEVALVQEVAERTWEAGERVRVSQALRDSEDRLTFALGAAEVGSWEMSLETRKYTASEQALAFFDLPAGEQPSYEEVVARMHSDDQLAVDKAIQRTAETGRPLKIEFRRLLSDGSTRWLDARAERRSVSGRQVIGGLIHDITERVNQKEAAERAAKAKSEFLSNMSHELRTPMHAILGYCEICTNAVREGEGEDIEKYLKNITTAGGRLLGLLNDLLDLSKMEAGKMEYKIDRSDLKDVVEHSLMELDPLIRAKNLKIRVGLEGHTEAFFDKTHIVQVLINLVSNAIKFSSAGSEIGIELHEDRLVSGERGVRCAVIDEGPGISEDELEAVFDKFVQGKKTKTGKGGTGLGLAICDHIVKAHGGTIWAENVKPHGAVFTFVIPKDHDASGRIGNVVQAGG